MRNLNIITGLVLILVIAGLNTCAYAADNTKLNYSAGQNYAGFGYTHGYIPVNVGTGGYYDTDIMDYDVNNSQYYYKSPFGDSQQYKQQYQQEYSQQQEPDTIRQ